MPDRPAVPGVPSWPADLLAPPFAGDEAPGLMRVLADLMPPAGAAPISGRDVVLLLDGLGTHLLAEHRSLTPTLRRLEGETQSLRTVAPSTTSTALVSLLTGEPALAHGVLGYTTIDRRPAGARALNQLTGAEDADPMAWMPLPTLGERTARRCVHVGPSAHENSHLTRLAYRGWGFVGHRRVSERVDAIRLAVKKAGQDGLVYVHVADVDHAGHRYGVDSDAWRTALGEVDVLLATLLRRLPPGTRVHITADHGMIDTSPAHTVDLADHPSLRERIAVHAGEPRAAMLATAAGQDPAELAGDLAELMGDRALVLQRSQVLAAGLLGPLDVVPEERVMGRLPDVLVLGRGRWVLDDSTTRRADHSPQVGVHGSLTAAESLVPHLVMQTG
ncbi:MAG: alkaline phosphatase family protein [Brachybacterium sp.]|nr:alkaline phosphatase family protein [Brachybacterium sp.]